MPRPAEPAFTWQLRGGIKVAVPVEPVVEQPPAPRWQTVHDLIACPTCHARVDETCRTKSGHTTQPHGSRLVNRRCCCGELVLPNARYCASCAAKRLQASKNDHARRRRAAQRARYA